MKSNVDLTLNRDFEKRNEASSRIGFRSTSFNIFSMLEGKYKFPWNCWRVQSNEEQEVFYTGTKQERQKKKKWDLYYLGLECERCGIDLSNTPWKMSNLLCNRCEALLDEEILGERDLVISSMR